MPNKPEAALTPGAPWRTIFAWIAAVVAVYFTAEILNHLRSTLLVLLLSGFVALLLNPLVLRLQRWGIRRRGIAVGIVSLVAIAAFAALAAAFGYPLVNGLTHLADATPRLVRQAEQGRGFIGHLLRRYHVERWLQRNNTKLVSLARGLSKPALALGRGAISALFTLITMFFFVVLLLLEGPRLRSGFFVLTPSAQRERFERIGRAIAEATVGYMVGSLLLSFCAGVVTFVALSLLHVPFALLFALWVFLVDFLPQIGGALAAIPTVAFACFHSLQAGVAFAVVFFLYTLVQDHVLNPIVMSKKTRVNPLAVFLSIVVGAQLGSWVGGLFGGFVGVLLAVPAAAAISAVVKSFTLKAP